MTTADQSGWQRWRDVIHAISLYLIIGATALLALFTALASFGFLPWPAISASYGNAVWAEAGRAAQIGLTALMLVLCFFLPANLRMARLERSHRDFSISMQDVARAYALAHAADRQSTFSLSSEFDAVRERIRHLRAHPDLASLEPGVLEVAAQMSHESHELAKLYSEEKVARAKGFLRQRQEEVQSFKDRIAIARMTCDELKRWRDDLVAEERVAETQIKRLEKDLREVLPLLGYDLEDDGDNVVQMAKPQK